MAQYLGGAVVTLDCPECDTRIKVTVDHLRASAGLLRCHECASKMTIDSGHLRMALDHLAAVLNTVMAGRVRNGELLESLPVLVTH